MKRYYQPKGGKKGKFALRENTYRRIWYMIADYPYFKSLESGLQFANSVARDSVEFANSVAETAPMYDTGQIGRYIKAIEDAIELVPEAYIEYVMAHIIERKRYKDMGAVSEKTIKLWVQRFIWQVARNLGEV